jgi:hypothetical protein
MEATLISACQMFLVPVSILFGALGVAQKHQLKTLISAMGVLTSIIWFNRALAWEFLAPVDRGTVRPGSCILNRVGCYSCYSCLLVVR